MGKNKVQKLVETIKNENPQAMVSVAPESNITIKTTDNDGRTLAEKNANKVFGHTVSAIVRYMGTQHFTTKQAFAVLQHFNCKAENSTVTTKLYDGRKLKPGTKIAVVTDEQANEMKSIAEAATKESTEVAKTN